MPALTEALVPTAHDVLVSKESKRQMGGLKFGRKESVAMQIEGKEVAVPVGVMRMMIAAVGRFAEGNAAGEQNHSAPLPGEPHQKPRSLGHRLAHPERLELPTRLIPIKVRDHQRENAEFVTLLTERTTALQTQPAMREDFMKEMRRFLPTATVRDTIDKEAFWSYLADLVEDLGKKALEALK